MEFTASLIFWGGKMLWKRKHRYEVFYAIRPDFQEFTKATLGDILSKYEKVTDIWARNLEEVFRITQGEMWSPRGEANAYIRRLGLTHTSMSVGDLVRDKNGKWFICANEGFKELKVEPL